METNNKDLVLKRTGQVQLSEQLFSPEQVVTFEKVSAIVDRNPVLDWKADSHNLDFCLIEGTIEAVKNFHLKVQYVAGLSIANTGTEVIGAGADMAAVSRVRVWKEGDKRIVEVSGGASFRECGGVAQNPNKRAFHDMVARSQTRAVKAGIEAYMGFPFINLIIQKQFGSYGVTGKPEDEGTGGMKDITGSADEKEPTGENRKIATNIYRTLEQAEISGVITKQEFSTRWDRVKAFYNDQAGLLTEQTLVNKYLQERKNEKAKKK